jgi:predicted Zn-dependent protease
MKKTIAIVLIAFIWIFTSCASTSGTRYREGDNRGQETNLTVADEERLAQEALPKMQKDYPPANNPELQRYVSQLGMKIVRANNLEGNPYHYDFTVVDVKNVNAFALPAGKVFVTVPLIAMASNEAELAGVIGHEIGHVKARHAAERMYAMEKAQNKTWLYAAAGGVVGAAAGLGLGLILCRTGDTACLARAAVLGGAVGAGGGLLVQKYSFMANSREDEMEADRIGFRLAVGAGYDKDQVGRFYEKLLQMEKSAGNNSGALKSLADAMSTHPPSEERVKQMHEMAAASPGVKGAVVTTPAFARARQLAAGMQKKERQ